MRTVRMRYHVTGGRPDGTDWPDLNETLTCEDGEAAELVAYGMADWADLDAEVTAPPADPPADPPAEAVPAEPPAAADDAAPAGEPAPAAAEEPDGPPPSGGPAPDGRPTPPPVRAPRADWAAHAVGLGVAPADVDEMTKAQLIAQYGNGATS
jgi:hypothetical protein